MLLRYACLLKICESAFILLLWSNLSSCLNCNVQNLIFFASLLCTCFFACLFCYSDIRLLYVDGYREPTDPKPVKKQPNPPSVPISEVYSGGDYPLGMEMPYTVSFNI